MVIVSQYKFTQQKNTLTGLKLFFILTVAKMIIDQLKQFHYTEKHLGPIVVVVGLLPPFLGPTPV
jgi:hypothetical protein